MRSIRVFPDTWLRADYGTVCGTCGTGKQHVPETVPGRISDYALEADILP